MHTQAVPRQVQHTQSCHFDGRYPDRDEVLALLHERRTRGRRAMARALAPRRFVAWRHAERSPGYGS